MGLISGSVLALLFNNVAIVILLTIATLIYLSTLNHDFFKKRGVAYEKPWPIIGNTWRSVFRLISIPDDYKNLYNKYPKESVVGIFEFIKPSFMIRDPELIKQICIKEFDSFMNHRQSIDFESDPFFGRGLFAIKDQRWKDMRSILSPAFTGSKMRYMYDLIRDCAKNSFSYVEKVSHGKPYEFEAKDLFGRLANDIIATSAFGIEVNSIEKRENTFYKNGKILTTFDALVSMKFFMYLSFPKLMNTLKIPLLDKETSHYFKNIVLDTMNHRAKSGIVRPDMIQLLLQTKAKIAQNNTKDQIQWTDDDFVAQSILFFLGGFDTTSNLFSFVAYEIAINKEVQDKLIAEIDNFLSNAEGKEPTYEDIHRMKYLDMVIQETLRKWPPAIFTDRVCNKQVTIQDSNGQSHTFYPGDALTMAAYGIQTDPKYFPNPDKFDPERFSDENTIDPSTLLTFGIGPRNCIGNRFALMECKILFYYMLAKFRIVASAKTEIPLKIKKGVFQHSGKNGIWLSLAARK